MGLEPLSADQVAQYWEERHRRLDDLLSGGDTSFDRASNEAFYAWRFGLLHRLVSDLHGGEAPLHLLDAGCGKGWFARAFARCGHLVDAIDASQTAIDHCHRAGGGVRYARSTLAAWHSPWLYDVVYAVDVLFHIVDDTEWQASISNLATLVRLGGRLIVSDWLRDERLVLADYMVVRPPSAYRACLGDPFWEDGVLPYDYRGSRIGLRAFTRVS